MPVIGLRDTSGFTASQRPENWREALLLLNPNSAEAAKAPLTALTSLMKTKSTDDPVFHWFTKQLDDRRLKLASPMTSGATSIAVDASFKSSFIVYEKTLMYVEATGEIILVTANPTSAGTIVVRRGVGSTPAAVDPTVAGTNPYLLIIGSAFEEGSMPPPGMAFEPQDIFNYTQIFRRTLEMTRTAQKTRLRTGDQVKEARRECLEYMSVDMERGFILGRRSLQSYNGRPQRMTGGIIWQIEQAAPENIVTLPGSIDMDRFEIEFEKMFRYGSFEKMAFGGNGALLALQQLVRKNTQYQISEGEKEYGMRVTRFTTPFGVLVLKVHPLFTQTGGGIAGGTSFSAMTNWLLVLDMDQMTYRHLVDSDVDWQANLEANGLDGMQAGYLGECGLELGHAKTCFLWKNLVSGKKDA